MEFWRVAMLAASLVLVMLGLLGIANRGALYVALAAITGAAWAAGVLGLLTNAAAFVLLAWFAARYGRTH